MGPSPFFHRHLSLDVFILFPWGRKDATKGMKPPALFEVLILERIDHRKEVVGVHPDLRGLLVSLGEVRTLETDIQVQF